MGEEAAGERCVLQCANLKLPTILRTTGNNEDGMGIGVL
jgi:hypothetical protein